jgi:hypothetical protein
MLLVLTVPDGVTTDRAWVTAPVFFTVIVIVPVFATVGEAGVILNSFSLSVSWPPPPPLDAGAEEAEDDELVAGALDAAGAELVLLLEEDEPQPATTAAMASGAMKARRRIWLSPILMVALVLTPRHRKTFPTLR